MARMDVEVFVGRVAVVAVLGAICGTAGSCKKDAPPNEFAPAREPLTREQFEAKLVECRKTTSKDVERLLIGCGHEKECATAPDPAGCAQGMERDCDMRVTYEFPAMRACQEACASLYAHPAGFTVTDIFEVCARPCDAKVKPGCEAMGRQVVGPQR